MAISKKLRQRYNENSAKYFAVGIGAIIFLFMIFHWTRFLYKQYGLKSSRTIRVLKLPVVFARFARRFLIRKLPGFVSAGHGLVFLGYIVTNVCITFLRIDWTTLTGFAKRLGWVTLSNLVLVILLSLKNTPIAFLTAYSYERLQPLHQIAGYTSVACMFMHAIVYIAAWDYSDSLDQLLEKNQIMGIVAGLSLLAILVTPLLRKKQYELFYILHIILAILILITAALHRPNLKQNSSYAIVFCGTVWVLDRLIRVSKLSIYRLGNKATLTPLPHGGTRIVLRKSPMGARAGMHLWLHLPSVRKVELHPFTIVSTKPLELVVVAQDGFTRGVYAHAIENPGIEISASVDGPYGSVPDFRHLDRVVFIAGGSGGSHIAGVAVDLLRKLGDDSSIAIEFIWVVRHTEMLTWFETYLAELCSSARVNMRIHVTHHVTASASTSSSGLDEKAPSLPISTDDEEKAIPCSSKEIHSSARDLYTILDGRPDILAVISNNVANASKSDRVAVIACGPGGMMLEVRKAVADNLRIEGPSLELHSEHFGW
ncbi:hypothetical protein EG329_011353 [Mollisiaceae sp. DMI_Dod_QoI]|nr:hypothetical protein EG329_011353 [Helotiales sp. DMI_Dod_QoI]